MSSGLAPTLPIAKATLSKDEAGGGNGAAGGRSNRAAGGSKNKQRKWWADYTPTNTPTPWADGMMPYAFGPCGMPPPFMSVPHDVEPGAM